MTSRCRWIYDNEVPGGKFLVPGRIERAILALIDKEPRT